MLKNLHLYITRDDYSVMAGPDWPAYEDFLKGEKATKPQVDQEIQDYIKRKRRDGILFPIRTETSCQSKWTWSTIYLNQLATASCHRVGPVQFTLDEFDNFHNLPRKLQDRRMMLEGKWPGGGCEYCKDIEQAGGHSDRMHNLDIRGLTPPELEDDPTAIEVTPRILEIFAQNTCNLSCTYCNPYLSSKIEQEHRKFGTFEKQGVKLGVPEIPALTDAYFEKFMSWLERNIHQLRRLHLLGGETFIQHELMNRVLDILERHPSPELQFCIFSNMNVPDRYWDEYTGRIQDLQQRGHIEVFDLTASIDCWGAEAEYARFGLNLEKFEKRFAWAAEQPESWLRLNVNQTVTCLTMKTMPGLIDKVREYSKHRHIGHYFQFYTGTQMFHHPKIFPYSFWADTFQEIYAAMPNTTERHEEARLRMTGMEQLLKAHTEMDREGVQQLHILLDELDRRRKTTWRQVFPYLDVDVK
jgi:hypothetical protein